MKKVFIILCVLFFSIFLVSCKKEIKFNMEELSEEMILKMKEAYIMYYNNYTKIDELKIEHYYGEYNGIYAITMFDASLIYVSEIVPEIIGGVEFEYGEHPEILIYNEYKIYRLKEAYDKRIINKEYLLIIKENMKNDN